MYGPWLVLRQSEVLLITQEILELEHGIFMLITPLTLNFKEYNHA